MLESVSKIYQARRMDSFTPVTKKRYETAQAQNELNQAQIMVHIQQLAEATGIELVQAEELENVAVEIVLQDRKTTQIETEMVNYERREQQYLDNGIVEKVRRFTGNPNLNPLVKYGMTEAQPAQKFVVENNTESIVSMFEKMNNNQQLHQEQTLQTIKDLTSTFAQAMQTKTEELSTDAEAALS